MKNDIVKMPMKTVCVGRFLMDIPVAAEISFGSGRIGGWEVSRPISESGDEFEKRLVDREHELRNQKNQQDQTSLETTKTIATEQVLGKAFMFGRTQDHYFQDGRRVDSQSVSFESMIHSSGRSFELSADYRTEEDLPPHVKVASQFERWSFNQLPTKPGFCFGDAFVTEPLPIDGNEYVMMFIGIESHPDLAIAISTWANIQLEAPLLERDRNNTVKQAYASRFKDLGTGHRMINGISGGQTADEVSEFNGTTGFSFQWESAMENNSVRRPRILLEFDTGKGRPGKPVNSSLSKTEALALWNKISSSIRDRPQAIPDTEK
ncbi:T6SS immunity protein Tli4 family protein [Pseudoduganella violaceinigra]|uniref:T6SS immunity protein Tli4 family protein n=1 Tax=Pseudoduganella violaceinigra TaxID=246602 RepID=UPI0004823B4E|nr:T6SS immunity protein Tli4 family protein [Pseudoduganella violaceinigra]